MRRIVARTGATMCGVLVAVLSSAAPASAHVTVSSASAVQGGWAKLTFRVPNEKSAADTVKLEITLPAEMPVASLSTKPVAGWTVQATKTEAVTKLTWTATPDAAVKPGQFQEFDVSAGPLPEVDTLVFKALQTYSDGDIVRWIEEPAADGKQPGHPAPTLKLAAKAATDPVTRNAAVTTTADHDARVDAGLGLGLASAVLSLVAVVLASLALRRRRAAAP